MTAKYPISADPLATVFGPLATVFGPLATVFGRLATVFGPSPPTDASFRTPSGLVFPYPCFLAKFLLL
jgi:hypothetical protein